MLVRQGKVRYIGCSDFFAWQVVLALGISERRGFARFAAVDAMHPIAERRRASVAQIALAWLLCQTAVTSVVLTVRNPEQLVDSFGAIDIKLTEEEMAALDKPGALSMEYPPPGCKRAGCRPDFHGRRHGSRFDQTDISGAGVIKGLREQLGDKRFVLNGYCKIPDAYAAEIYAMQGWDSVTLDMQHGLIGYQAAVAMLHAIARAGVLPMVRVPWLEPSIIMRLLDAGALGITCPMVNTAEDARRLVQYCNYAPQGVRSFGPVRARLLYGADYVKNANRMVSVLAMIETTEALANLDDILSVAGLDGIYIGAMDLALSMGKSTEGPVDPAVAGEIENMLQQCIKRGLVAGIIARNAEQARQFIKRGFRFITLASDADALTAQARQWFEGCRKGD